MEVGVQFRAAPFKILKYLTVYHTEKRWPHICSPSVRLDAK